MKNSKLIVTISLVLFFSVYGFSQSDPIHESISIQEADSIILALNDSSNFVILDVRTAEEYESGHIENAINVDYNAEEFNQNLGVLNKKNIYLMYCAGGGRSAAVFNKMKTLEFENLYNMLGGINAWIAAGFPVVKGGGTGIYDFFIQQSQLSFYPNPITPDSKFHFISTETNSCYIILLNIQGQIVDEFYLQAGDNKVLSDKKLPPGLYFYKATIGGLNFKSGRLVNQ